MLYTSYAAETAIGILGYGTRTIGPQALWFSTSLKHRLYSTMEEDEQLVGMKFLNISHTELALSQGLLEAQHPTLNEGERHLHSSSPIDLHVDPGDKIRLIRCKE